MLFIDNQDSVFWIMYLQLNLPLAEASRKSQIEREGGKRFCILYQVSSAESAVG